MKATPKSCSCFMCRLGKSSGAAKVHMKKEERAFRHQCKIDLKKGKEDIPAAPHGDYTD